MTDSILLLMEAIVGFCFLSMCIAVSAMSINLAVDLCCDISDRLRARRTLRRHLRHKTCIIDDVNYVGDIAG